MTEYIHDRRFGIREVADDLERVVKGTAIAKTTAAWFCWGGSYQELQLLAALSWRLSRQAHLLFLR